MSKMNDPGDSLGKLLIEKGLITQAEFMQKLSAERAVSGDVGEDELGKMAAPRYRSVYSPSLGRLSSPAYESHPAPVRPQGLPRIGRK